MHFSSVLLASVAASLAFAQEGGDSQDLTSILERPELSELASLLERFPEVAPLVAGGTNITFFAPNNDAFAELDLDGLEDDQVRELLQYHVSAWRLPVGTPNDTFPYIAPTFYQPNGDGIIAPGIGLLSGDDDQIQVLSGLGQRANVVEGPIDFGNGNLHIIDAVLTLPLNIPDTALATGLNALAGALIEADLVDTVNEETSITVFAPNNAAFEAIASGLGELSDADLQDILQYHVGNAALHSGALVQRASNGESADSITGEHYTLSLSDDGDLFVNNARVLVPDIIIENGVLHVIDAVLNPDDTAAQGTDSEEPTVVFPDAEEGDLPFTSALPAAPTQVDVVSDATAEGAAAKYTGVVGAAALFGGAVLLGNL